MTASRRMLNCRWRKVKFDVYKIFLDLEYGDAIVTT